MLCLSHGDMCKDEFKNDVILCEGMLVTAFDEDIDLDGNRDDLLAHGIVERSPEWLQCKGSKWVLRIDERGIHNESEEKLAE